MTAHTDAGGRRLSPLGSGTMIGTPGASRKRVTGEEGFVVLAHRHRKIVGPLGTHALGVDELEGVAGATRVSNHGRLRARERRQSPRTHFARSSL